MKMNLNPLAWLKRKHHGRPTNPANENAALYQIILSQIEKAQGGDRVVIVALIADYMASNLSAIPVGTLRSIKRRLQGFNATKGEWIGGGEDAGR